MPTFSLVQTLTPALIPHANFVEPSRITVIRIFNIQNIHTELHSEIRLNFRIDGNILVEAEEEPVLGKVKCRSL